MDENNLSLLISIVSAFISFIALVVGIRNNYNKRRPYLVLSSMSFNPKNFKYYTNKESHSISQEQKITPELNEMINNCKEDGRNISIQLIDGEKYLMVNLLKKNSSTENTVLVLGALESTYYNTGVFSNEIELVKCHTKISEDNRLYRLKGINASIKPKLEKNGEFSLKLAYICREGYTTSIFYNYLLENIIEDSVDLLTDKEFAKKIINFDKEKLFLYCINNEKNKYLIRIIIEMDSKKGLTVKIK